MLVSQASLVLGAMAGGKHKGVVVWFRSLWTRVQPALGRVVTGAVILAGAFLLLDAGWWFVTGELLVPISEGNPCPYGAWPRDSYGGVLASIDKL